jgi:hypothetical protein
VKPLLVSGKRHCNVFILGQRPVVDLGHPPEEALIMLKDEHGMEEREEVKTQI